MKREGNPEFLRRAIQLATENVTSGRGGPFGAVIVRDGRIIAEGANQVTASNDPTAHAEVTALRNAARALNAFDLSGCEVYSSCEPCPMCLSACYWSRVDALYFAAGSEDAARAGFDDSFLYGEMRKDSADRRLPSVQLLRDEAWQSFAAWIASPSKVEY